MATVLLSLLILAVFGLEQALGANGVCHMWGLVPAHPSFGSAVSSMFLHDGFAHIAGNLVFLLIFGLIVERAIGSLRFLALYLAAGIGGALAHCLVSGNTLVGASGGICGLIAFAVAVDRRFVGFGVAFAGVSVWQALMGGAGEVSFGAHIGGLFVGAMVAVACSSRMVRA